MYFFELEGCHLLFPIEGPKILNYSVTIRRLQAEQRGVEHFFFKTFIYNDH